MQVLAGSIDNANMISDTQTMYMIVGVIACGVVIFLVSFLARYAGKNESPKDGTVETLPYAGEDEDSYEDIECDKCGHSCPSDGRFCITCGNDAMAPGDQLCVSCDPSKYVNVYLHDRAYGGPEEGGWWYDTYDPIFSTTIPGDIGWLDHAVAHWQKWCDDRNRGRRGIDSVLSEGRYHVEIERHPASMKPSMRPFYE